MRCAVQLIGKGDVLSIAGRRVLAFRDATTERLVTIAIHTPEPIDPPLETCCACAYEIEGLGSHLDLADDDVHVLRFEASDSVQALIFALQGIQTALRPYESSLSWLDMEGDHGFPLVLYHSNDFGAAFRHRIETLVESEVGGFLARTYPHDFATFQRGHSS